MVREAMELSSPHHLRRASHPRFSSARDRIRSVSRARFPSADPAGVSRGIRPPQVHGSDR